VELDGKAARRAREKPPDAGSAPQEPARNATSVIIARLKARRPRLSRLANGA
jgi:hypothetical protein